MTNKEAIEILKEEWRVNAEIFGKQFDEALDLAIKALEERPQNEWIIGRNPKRSGFYITTCEDICCRNIRVCCYDAVQKKWSRGGVVAWMPKPEPYED